MNPLENAKNIADWMIERRRLFHRHPELGNQEVWTTARLLQELSDLGIGAEKISKTGVVGTIRGKGPGKTVALRADIDALPVTEQTGYDFASGTPGMMHACGHDGHMGMLLGAARMLQETRDSWNGSVRLIFQTAEELGLGANEAIAAGALDGVDAIFGMHLFPLLETGKIAVQEGPVFASGDSFNFDIFGRQCHGSSPWDGVDAIACACAAVMNLQTIVSRVNDARLPIVINVGTIQGGDRSNITPGHVAITGSTRSFDEGVRKQLPDWIEQVIKGTCDTYRCTYTYEYIPLLGAVINPPDLIRTVRGPLREALGHDAVTTIPEFMGSEDFSFYQYKVPGVYYAVGCRNEKKDCIYSMHSDHYKMDEDALPYGAAAYVTSALSVLQEA